MKEQKIYKNDDVSVVWRPSLCTHCGNCISGLPSVFNLDRRPWVDVDAATPAAIVAQVAACPTGALSIGDLHAIPD